MGKNAAIQRCSQVVWMVVLWLHLEETRASTQQPSVSPTTTPTTVPITIGLALRDTEAEQLQKYPDLSKCRGWYCSLNQLCAAKSAIAAINQNSTILPTTTLDLATFKSGCDRTNAIQAASDMSEVDNLKVVVGPMCSTAATVMAPILGASQIPLLSHSAAVSTLSDKSKYPWFLRVAADDSSAGGATIIATMEYFGWQTIGLFYQGDDEWARAIYTDVFNAIEARNGMDVVFRQNVTLDGTGIVGAVDSFKETGSSVYGFYLNAESITRALCKELKDHSLAVKGYAMLSADSLDCTSIYPQDFIGAITFQMALPQDVTSRTRSQAWIDENQPNCAVDLMANIYSVWAYDAVFAAALALDEAFKGCQSSADCIDSTTVQFSNKLREALFKTNFDGVNGKVSITQCDGANYNSDNLDVREGAKCGDRVEQNRMMENWRVTSRRDTTPKWVTVGRVIQSSDGSTGLDITGDVVFLGDTAQVPGAQCITNWCVPPYGETRADDAPPNCVRRPPANKIKNRDTYWILKGGWDSVDAMSTMVKILMNDVLDYSNVHFQSGAWEHDWEPIRSMGGPSVNGKSGAGKALKRDPKSQRYKNLCTMDENDGLKAKYTRCFLEMEGKQYGPDIYMEHWPTGYEEIDNTMYWHEQSVVRCGPIGYFGTVGLYATSTSSKLAEGCNAHWSRYDTLMELANLTSFSALQPNWDWKSAGAHRCDKDNTSKFSFCEAGRYTPPQCVDNPDCVDVVMNRPTWETSMIEQIITQLNLHLNTVYVGPEQWVNEMQNAVNSGRQQLFYDFSTTVTTTQLDLSRIELPKYVPSQHATDDSNPDAANRWEANGPVASDFPDNILTKVVSSKLRDDAVDVFQLVGAIEMKKTYMDEILKQLKISGNTNTEYYNTACHWLRNNTVVWKSWIPDTTCNDGFDYHFSTNTCVEIDDPLYSDTELILFVALPSVIVVVALLGWWWWCLAKKKSRKKKSTMRGVSLSYLLNANGLQSDAHEAVQKGIKDCTLYESKDCDERVLADKSTIYDPNFYQIKEIMAGCPEKHCKHEGKCPGQYAIGKGIKCPRDWKKDCSVVDAFHHEYTERREKVKRAGHSTRFLSWSWSYKVSTFKKCIEAWRKSAGQINAMEEFFWICFFCNNQFRPDICPDTFKLRMVTIRNIIAFLDTWKKPVYLRRKWCIYEVFEEQKIQVELHREQAKELKDATDDLEKAQEDGNSRGAEKAKKRVRELQSDRCDEMSLTFVLPEEEELTLRMVLEKPEDKGFKEVINFLFKEINVSEAKCGQEEDEKTIDKLITTHARHNELRSQQPALGAAESKQMLRVRKANEELVQAKKATGNAIEQARTEVENAEVEAAEHLGLNNEHLLARGTEQVDTVVRQRMLNWVAQVATGGKKKQIEALIHKHTTIWYEANGKCHCSKLGGVCCCKLTKRWDEDGFRDLTFGRVEANPVPALRGIATLLTSKSKIASGVLSAVEEANELYEESNNQLKIDEFEEPSEPPALQPAAPGARPSINRPGVDHSMQRKRVEDLHNEVLQQRAALMHNTTQEEFTVEVRVAGAQGASAKVYPE